MKMRPTILVKPFTRSRMWSNLDNNKTVILEEEKEVAAVENVSDRENVKRIAKLHSDIEVSQTLDKLELRKEYHEALARNGLSLDVIIKDLKVLLATAKDDTKFKTYQMILKSLGLDKYETTEGGGKNWEELILKISEEEKKGLPAGQGQVIEGQVVYPVKVPEIPAEVLAKKQEEEELNKSIYEQWDINRDKPGGNTAATS